MLCNIAIIIHKYAEFTKYAAPQWIILTVLTPHYFHNIVTGYTALNNLPNTFNSNQTTISVVQFKNFIHKFFRVSISYHYSTSHNSLSRPRT